MLPGKPGSNRLATLLVQLDLVQVVPSTDPDLLLKPGCSTGRIQMRLLQLRSLTVAASSLAGCANLLVLHMQPGPP